MNEMNRLSQLERQELTPDREQSGFTLIEVAIAMVVILVALLGVVFTFTYSIMYNMGNNSRSQALAVLQQEVEQMRAAKFTPTITDSNLSGHTSASRTITNALGTSFTITESVDNDPFTTGVQDNSVVTDANCTYKEITVTVQLSSPSPGWQTAVPSTVILRRARAN
jgi:prepilin-type N-terminal cleavage/methylation domain-containing protein